MKPGFCVRTERASGQNVSPGPGFVVDERDLLLERFHVALVASIERTNPGYLRQPFTVGEIYRDLIPYRTHRDLIGVAMNGDYEHGLMRLLAGHGNYLILESPEVREAISEELEGKAPDTSLFKDYDDAIVRLNPELLGVAPPPEERAAVARLFEEGSTRGGSSGGRWGLGGRPSPSKAQQPRPVAPEASLDAGAPPAGPPQDERASTRATDEVGTSQKFWMEAATPPNDASDSRERDESQRLEEENRRLKILLAERVLEVEELRERLDKGGSEARREDR